MTTAKNAQTYLSGELLPVEKTTYKFMELSRAPTENGSCFHKYFHGEGRNRDLTSKRFKTARLETIH